MKLMTMMAQGKPTFEPISKYPPSGRIAKGDVLL
jgi:hypothetical protein